MMLQPRDVESALAIFRMAGFAAAAFAIAGLAAVGLGMAQHLL